MLFEVFTAYGVVMAGSIGFHNEVREFLFGGLFESVVFVYHRRIGVQPGGRPEEEAELDSIGFTNAGVTTFTHANLTSFAGCYVVTATDSAGNESVASNQVCKDNCFFFRLPNIFTPNNDEKNDTFRPDPRSRFIKSIKFTVFNRWGEKVFEGDQDPNINWRGVNNAGNDVSEGTYYYLAEVEFLTSNPANARRNYKGWVEIVR